jgi:putative zinc finger protein
MQGITACSFNGERNHVNCLDAETLAAWMDGGLKGAALEDVQTHVAGCERCQMLLGAMGRTRGAVPATEPRPASRRWLAWAVPLTAAAAAIAIWIAIPEQRQAPTSPSPARIAVPLPTEAVPVPQQKAEAEQAPVARSAPPLRRAEPSAADNIAPATPAESAPPPAAAPAARPLAEQRAVAAGEVQQRAAAAAGDAAAFCGPEPPPAAAGQLIASSAPSPDVCWVAGRGGLVMRSLDQRTWQRINFPETSDLTAVTATDSSTATVRDADGRMFRTTDGGLTWTRQ